MEKWIIGIFIICCGSCIFGGLWYSPREVCAEMVSEQWHGDKETCQGIYESGYQPCLIVDTRQSAYCRLHDYPEELRELAYCRHKDYPAYKVFDAVSTGDGELTYIGTYDERSLILVCASSNIFCNTWQR
ncbi:MAG: hypothetical protein WAZ14_03380 [Patescibacteria group bacterium]